MPPTLGLEQPQTLVWKESSGVWEAGAASEALTVQALGLELDPSNHIKARRAGARL